MACYNANLSLSKTFSIELSSGHKVSPVPGARRKMVLAAGNLPSASSSWTLCEPHKYGVKSSMEPVQIQAGRTLLFCLIQMLQKIYWAKKIVFVRRKNIWSIWSQRVVGTLHFNTSFPLLKPPSPFWFVPKKRNCTKSPCIVSKTFPKQILLVKNPACFGSLVPWVVRICLQHKNSSFFLCVISSDESTVFVTFSFSGKKKGRYQVYRIFSSWVGFLNAHTKRFSSRILQPKEDPYEVIVAIILWKILPYLFLWND